MKEFVTFLQCFSFCTFFCWLANYNNNEKQDFFFDMQLLGESQVFFFALILKLKKKHTQSSVPQLILMIIDESNPNRIGL
jgi:hypothetical protein